MNAEFTPMEPGPELLIAAYNQIRNHPETWNQESWHCDTSHCFGGWCAVLAGKPTAGDCAIMQLLQDCGMSEDEADDITYPGNTLQRLYNLLIEHLTGNAPDAIPPAIDPKDFT